MKFNRIQEIVGAEPLFDTGLLLAGDVEPASVSRQLSRLVASGRVLQLRRGLYALAPPFQKVKPHPFAVANRIVRASYVSLQSALAYHGMIPESVPMVTSVTTARPGRWENAFGAFQYRHIKTGFFFGYRAVDVGAGQTAMVAAPEKALLDLLYLEPGSDSPEFLRELRLQELDSLDFEVMTRTAAGTGRPRLSRAVETLEQMARVADTEYEAL